MKGCLVSLVSLLALSPMMCVAGDSPAPPAPAVPAALAQAGPEVSRYALKLLAAEARANAESLGMEVSPAERQAFLLVAQLRARHEVSADALPAGYKEYALGVREAQNAHVPGMIAAFLSVAAGLLEEEELTGALTPAETALYDRLEELGGAYPEAAAALGSDRMTELMLELTRALMPGETPGAAGRSPEARKAQAGFYLRLAEKIEGLAEGE